MFRRIGILPFANEVCGKVILLHLSVSHSVHRGDLRPGLSGISVWVGGPIWVRGSPSGSEGPLSDHGGGGAGSVQVREGGCLRPGPQGSAVTKTKQGEIEWTHVSIIF